MKQFPGIQAVTFDAGGTLIEPWPSVGHVYAGVAAGHGFKDLSAEVLNRRFAAAWQARGKFDHTRGEWAEMVDQTFGGLVPENAARGFFPELYQRFAEAGAWRVYDDALPALETLKSRGIRLGLISNWDNRLRPLLTQLNLDGRFEVIVVSCEAGFTKPSPEIFQLAARELGVPGGAILHVGDSLEMDLHGASGAGLRAVRILRGAGPGAEDQIGSLLDLAGLV